MSTQASSSVRGMMGAVATSHGLATDAGAEILAKGGNAFDAAVAASLATGVVESYYSQLGGATIITYKTAHATPEVVQARGKTPHKLRREMFLDGDKVRHDLLDMGPLSVMVPSLLAGLCDLWRKHGRMAWDKLVAPAIRLASEGFCVDGFLSDYHRNDKVQEKLEKYGGPPFVLSKPYLEKGDLWVQKDLANTLSQIAEKGADVFYRGTLAEKIAHHLKKQGGVMEYSDLAEYYPDHLKPLSTTYRGWTVTAPPVPSVGGPQILQALSVLEGFSLQDMGFASSEYLHLLIETLKLTFMERAELPAEGITQDMVTREYGAALANRIDRHKAMPFSPDQRKGAKSRGTSHFCVIDGEGNLVSVTQTVRDLFGSGVVIPGTGVLLNNLVADFIVKPHGKRSGQTIREGTGNLVGPGLTPKSNKSPIVAYNEKTGAVIGIGAGGGPMIISGVLQVLINVIDFGMDLTNAQQAPRLHYHGDQVEVEGWIPGDVLSRLEAKGHDVRVFGGRARMRWAGGKVADEGPPVARRVMPCIVQCVARDEKGEFDAAADPRGPGNALILGKYESGLWAERYGYCMLGGAAKMPF